MWFIKDHLGKESGPYEFDDLIEVLSTSPYKENATLVRSGQQAVWKPALIAFPEVYSEPETHDDSTLPLPAGDHPILRPDKEQLLLPTPNWSNSAMKQITDECNRFRVVLAVGTVLILLFVVAASANPKTLTVSRNEVALSLNKSSFICVIFFLPAFTFLCKLLRYETKSTAESIHFTLTLHRTLMLSLCVAAVLSLGFQLIMTFMS